MNKEYPNGIDIEDEVRKFCSSVNAKVKSKGDEITFDKCPFCNGGNGKDKNTFSINLKTGMYKCLRAGCNEEGNLYSLSKDPRFTYSLLEEDPKQRIRKHTQSFKVNENIDERAEQWIFENRGIPAETTRKYKVAFGTEKFKRLHNSDGNCILSRPEKFLVWQFTNKDASRVLWYKFRRTEEGKPKEWGINNEFELDGKKYHVEPCLFGMGECDHKDDFVILTEGQFDTLAVSAAGFNNVVSVPTGATAFKWFDENEECSSFLNMYDTLIVFGDYEDGKISLLDGMSTRFIGKIKHIRFEDYKDCKDANDLLKKYGVEAIQNAINNAQPIKIRHIKSITEIKRQNYSDIPKIPTSIRSLDRLLGGGLPLGTVTDLTGDKGKGKSTFANQMIQFAVNSGYNAAVYSGELEESQFRWWFDLQVAGHRGIRTHANSYGDEVAYLTDEAMKQIDDWYRDKIFFYENSFAWDDEEDEEDDKLLDTIIKCIRQYNCKLIILDNLMSAMMDYPAENENVQQSRFVNKIVKIAKKFKVAIVLIAHLRKSQGKTKSNLDNDDVSGSANITNLADIVIRYDIDHEVEKDDPDSEERKLYVWKNRPNNGKTNRIGIDLHFDPITKRIYEHGTEPNWCFWNDEFEDVDDEIKW